MIFILKNLSVFIFGGLVYGGLELLWRQSTHWTMLITGGLCFYLLYKLFSKFPYMPLYLKCIAGAVIITMIEFTAGYIVNIIFKMNVWDYSFLPFNLMGQVCLLYSLLWGLLVIPIDFVTKFINMLFYRTSV